MRPTRLSVLGSQRKWVTRVRGDLYRLRADRRLQGHARRGPRYCVELQGPFNLSTVVVAPTSTSSGPAIFRPEITLADGTSTSVLTDQMRSVDRELRGGEFAGRLDPSELDEVDKACRLVLRLL
ncbi:type II toxin-antitoxin system PemK/MazF family toxin [Nocardiopsis valliformis]|uniref:type II toxin-antitoxin system PemK/MazF family toxin n=1 Tax=Nocardiopsis valliformis TaxID=239974 RepID=UPI001EF9E84E|nr:type II toxin-antitoxin system PemK/MazF family toxin [Nocardiopsis valliformis]